MIRPWDPLREALAETDVAPWSAELVARAQSSLEKSPHGDLARWLGAIGDLPPCAPLAELDRDAPALGQDPGDQGRRLIRERLMELHPWRKGPLNLGGVFVDTEWRSDWKWQRIAPHVGLEGQAVLDIGSGNGYFGWRMLGAGARCVVGIDPTLVFVMQWLAQAHFAPGLHNFVLPLRDRDLPDGMGGFDSVFSMGVLYHQRNPGAHLRRLHGWLANGGTVVLETLVLDRPGMECLEPGGRYARMRNVRLVPSPDWLIQALGESGFTKIRLLDVTPTTIREQRSTDWMTFESLAQCLDPDAPGRTVEGHPAPVRAVITARKA